MERIIDSMLLDMSINESAMIDMIDQVCDIGYYTESDDEGKSFSSVMKSGLEKVSKFIKYLVEQLKKFVTAIHDKCRETIHKIKFKAWVKQAQKVGKNDMRRIDVKDLPKVEKLTRKVLNDTLTCTKEMVRKYADGNLTTKDLEKFRLKVEKIAL